MRLIYCTKKLINELNSTIQSKEETHINQGLGDWYSNIFILNRRKCIIFVNIKTLCAFVVPDLLRKDLSKFQYLFIEGLVKILDNIELETNIKAKIIEEYTDIQLEGTESKSILGTMNDYIQLYKWTVGGMEDTERWTSEKFNSHINVRTNTKLEYKTPKDILISLIETEYKIK